MLNVYIIVSDFILMNMILRRKDFIMQNVGIPDHEMIYCVCKFTNEKMEEKLFFLLFLVFKVKC